MNRLLCWNVRGLNGGARRDVVADYVSREKVSLLCLQETKLAAIDDSHLSAGHLSVRSGTNFVQNNGPSVRKRTSPSITSPSPVFLAGRSGFAYFVSLAIADGLGLHRRLVAAHEGSVSGH
jgi:hypothetical protein